MGRRCTVKTVSQLSHIRSKLQTSRFSAIFSRGKLIVIVYSQDKSSHIPAYFPRYPQRAVRILRGKFHLFWLATSSWVLGTRQLSWSTLFWKYFKGFHGAWRGKVLISHSRFIFTRIPHPASRILHVFVRPTLNSSGEKAVTHTILFPLKTTHLNLLVVKAEQQKDRNIQYLLLLHRPLRQLSRTP